ncbi:MAG: MMPL family transporter [Candidatus Nanopelagicales bacterium]
MITRAPQAPSDDSSSRTSTARKGVWLAIGVAIIWLLISSWAGPLAGSLSQVQENDNAAFLPASAESTQVAEEQAKFAESTAIPLLVVISKPGGGQFTAVDQASIGAFVEQIPGLQVPDGELIADYLDPVPLVPIPSADGDAVLINVAVNGDLGSAQLDNGEIAFLGIVDAVRAAADGYPDLQVNVTGPGGFLADLIKVFGAIDTTLLIATALVVAVILIFVYRSPFLWLIPLLAAGIALSTASALVYVLADNDILVLNGQSQGILTVLVFGAGTDYSLLLVSRYREELHHHRVHTDAIRRAIRGTVEPIVASGATTSIGLMCLLLSELNSNKSTGPVSAIGVVAAVIVMLTFLPALLAIPSIVLPILAFLVPTIIGLAIGFVVDVPLLPFVATGGTLALLTVVAWIVFGIARIKGKGPFTRDRFPSGSWAFWPRVPRFGEEDLKLSGVWAKIARGVGRRPKFTWIATAIALLVLAGFSTTLKADGVATSESFVNASEVDSVIGQEILIENFDAGLGSETFVTTNESSVTDVMGVVEATPGVASVRWFNDVPPGVEGAQMAEPTVVDGRVLLLVTLSDPPDSEAAEAVIGDLRAELVDLAGANALVGGPTAVSYDINAANLRDRNVIIPLVLFVISIILIILLRSLVAPLILIGTVILSFFATLGACAIAFNYIFDFPGADASFPLFAFVFLVALGVDYNIFLMTRVREESKTIGTRPGILRGLTVTGGVITSAGIVLAATFLVLGVLPLVALRQVGFAVALGVLIDAFIVRTTLVPALAYTIGRKVWWPSALSRAEQPAEDERVEVRA